MEQIQLSAVPRTVVGKQVKQLRRENFTPGVIYGHGIEPLAVQFVTRELELALAHAGTSTLLNVQVAGQAQPYTVIVRALQRHPIKRFVMHVDMQALQMNEKVRVPVPVVLVGESAAVAERRGVLLHLLNEVEVECLPVDLVPAIEVDVTGLTELGAALTVGDLVAPPGIEILTPADEIVAQLSAAEEEEEFESAPAVDASAVEVVRKRKVEEVED